jgi:dipeptidyl-peptidase-4
MKKILTPILLLASCAAMAQSRLPSMPGSKDAAEFRPKLGAALKFASLQARWVDGKTLTWKDGEKWVLLDASTGTETSQTEEPPRPASGMVGGRNQGNPGRGRQFTEITSSDGKVATYRNGNVFVKDGTEEYQLTEGGDLSKRIKFGTASWVYGEELYQNEAMGFSPDGSKIWVYQFDERLVKDYFLAINQRSPQDELYPEAYPKPGQPNPIVSIYIYDLKTRKPVLVPANNGGGDEDPGHYQYKLRWSPDGSKLLFHRMNRRQNHMEFCSADPATGKMTVLDREDNPNGWVEQAYPTTYLDEIEGNPADLKGKALWLSERSGFCNIYLLDLNKGGVTPVTKHNFDVRRIVKFDPATRTLWYVAANGDRPALMQLNRIKLDGTGQIRLTDPAYQHDISLSADGSYFLDTAQNNEKAPSISIVDKAGKTVKRLRESDVSGMKSAGYEPVEMFSYKAADGVTDLSGRLHKPVNFDPNKKYPVICSVYGGPGGPTGNSFDERFEVPDRMCDYGFIVLELENRGLGGRGRAFRDAFYRKMGITEIDDMAAGVKSVSNRPYFDAGRVGITGTSYGAYSTLLAMLRYPDIFHAGVASSCVSDWRNYDSTYTERYMGLMPDDKAGYDAGSAVQLAGNLKGWLMVYYGTSDDNTHPTNTLQVIAALQAARKYFEVQVTPDVGHSGVNYNRMLEFFIERLVLNDSLPDGTKY